MHFLDLMPATGRVFDLCPTCHCSPNCWRESYRLGFRPFLDINRLMPTAQSAYRKYHSTETATAKVFNDLLLATDRGQVSALCLLDLIAAFDTVDHQLLLRRLECQFGLRGIALGWFQSYLSGRSYHVIYAGSNSSVIYIAYVRFGV